MIARLVVALALTVLLWFGTYHVITKEPATFVQDLLWWVGFAFITASFFFASWTFVLWAFQ